MILILATPSKTLNHIISIGPNLDHQNPSLSEFWSQAKVQVKVQKWGMSSICAWTLESSVATIILDHGECYATAAIYL